MKTENILKIISLTSYSLIILMGQMIGIPFLFWLIWTSFEFGNSDQIFAIFGLIGFIIMFTKFYKLRISKIFVLLLMLTPIIRRLTEVPYEKFNYLAFQIPLLTFITVSLIMIVKQKKEEKLGTTKNIVHLANSTKNENDSNK